ncbi:unnamed protein product [Urochloa humidicola]
MSLDPPSTSGTISNHHADENNVRRGKASTMNESMAPDPVPPQSSTDTNAPVCHHHLDPPMDHGQGARLGPSPRCQQGEKHVQSS